jgi:acyl-CoA dehydrogenase
MDFGFTEEQELIRTEVRNLARKFDWEFWRNKDKTGEYPHEFFDVFARAGWLGIAIPREYGGAGLGITEACILLLEIAASGAGTTGCTPIHFGVFPPMPIVKYGTAEQKRRYLPALAIGKLRMAFSVTEPDAGTDTTRITTRAVRDGDDWVITGQKVWTSNAKHAQKTLLLARTTPFDQVTRKTKGMSLFMADLDPNSCRLQEIDKLGRHAVDSNALFIDQLRVHRDDLIGQEGEGFYHLLDGINPERIVIAAEAVGIGKAALARAIDYAKSRVVFGRPIGQNQGIQFPLADAYSKLECAELMVFKAAWLFDHGHPCGKEANIAKLRAADAGFEACDWALQTHGGFGYAKEFDVERLWREIRLYKIAPVSQQMALNYIGEHVLGLPKSY